MRTRLVASSTVGGLLLAGVVLAAPAAAHVTVSAPDATQGGDAVVTFQVPDESDALDTTGLTVQLPQDAPLASVLAQPHPGWTYTATRTKLATPISSDDGPVTEAVTKVEWKAAPGGGIKPGEFDQFVLSVGPLPKTPTMTFKAIQTYSDGSQVAWIDVPAPGSTTEPEHPAPVLKLAADAASPQPSASGGPTATAVPTRAPTATAASNTGPVVISIVALLLAAAAAVLAGIVYAMNRRRRS